MFSLFLMVYVLFNTVLKQAFKITTLSSEKSHLLVAMALVAKNIESDGPNPLTLLYER